MENSWIIKKKQGFAICSNISYSEAADFMLYSFWN